MKKRKGERGDETGKNELLRNALYENYGKFARASGVADAHALKFRDIGEETLLIMEKGMKALIIKC